MLDALGQAEPEAFLLLLDTAEDLGFLANTEVTLDITPQRFFVTETLARRRGLGSWARGAFLDFADEPGKVPALVAYGRNFVSDPEKTRK